MKRCLLTRKSFLFICSIVLLASLLKAHSEESFWQPQGCPVAVPFPSKPIEKTVSNGTETVRAATLYLSQNAAIKASFNSSDASGIAKDMQFAFLQELASQHAAKNGMNDVQFDRENVPLGNRLTARGTKSISVAGNLQKVQFIIDYFVVGRGILSITVSQDLNKPDLSAMNFRRKVSMLSQPE